ncbi:MAG TPA: flagellar protein FliS, partial [Halanaerobiales bacterium]|nr:flagellar protein FliS [Halanaerobiales bacterium]
SRNLSSLYQFMNRKLVQANINKEIESVEMVEELLLEILETWKQVLNGEKEEKGKGVKMEA